MLSVFVNTVSAATRIKANNTTNLDQASSWDALPGSSDIARWDATVAAANTTLLGSNQSWLGMSILTPGGDVTISAGNTLTLGTSGIDMSSAGRGLTINCALALGGDQTWNTGGQILTVGEVISGSYGITKSGSGTLKLSRANTYTGATTVSAGTLQTVKPAVIQNGSFESPALSANSYVYISGMTAAQQAALIWTGGGALINNSTAWGYTTPYPAGDQAFSVQNTSNIIETIYFLTGSYTLSWNDVRRGSEVNPYNVQLDAANQTGSPFSAASSATWGARSTTLTIASEGFHTIAFVGTNSSGDKSVAVDNISLTTVSGGGNINVLPSTTALTVSGGATIDFDGNSHTIGSLAGAGTVTSSLTDAITLTTGGDNTSTVFSGAIQNGSGTVALAKAGSGTLTLSGTNTYTGTTTISAGTLLVTGSISTGAVFVTGTLNMAGTVAGALTVHSGGTIQPTISGANGGTLTLSSATSPVFNATSNLRIRAPSGIVDRVTLSNAAASFTCTNVALYIDATGLAGSVTGAIIVATANSAGITGTFSSVTGTAGYTYTLAYNANSITVDIGLPGADRYWSGTGTWDAPTSNWGAVTGGPYTATTFSTGKDAFFEGTAGTVTVSSPNNPNSLTFNVAGYTLSSGTLTLGGAAVITNASAAIGSVLAGTGNLFKSGSGTLTLSGTNTYTGATAVWNGTLSITTILNVGAGASAVGAPANATDGTIALGYTSTTGVLMYTGGAGTTDRIVDLAGTTGGGTIDNSGSGLFTLTSNVTATGPGTKTLTLQGSSAGVLSGTVVNGSAATALVKAGSSTWALSGANTYTGATTISAGTLQIGNGGATGSLSVSSAITNNAALAFNRTNTITQGVDFGTISGSGSLTQAGTGTLALSCPNTYSGATTVSAGTLQTRKVAAIQNGSLENPALSANNYTYYGSLSAAQKDALIWTSAGNSGGQGGCLLNGTNAWSYTTPYPAGNQVFSIQRDSRLEESIYFLAGSYTLSWYDARRNTQVNPYNVQLNGVNQTGSPFTAASSAWAARSTTLSIAVDGFYTVSFIGTVTASDQSVGLDNISLTEVTSAILPTTTALTVAGGATVDFNGNSQTIGSLAGAGTVTSTLAGAMTLTAGGANTSTTFSGAIQNGSGTVGLTKAGAGTLTLSGVNTYTGATAVNAGELMVNGSTHAGSAVTVTNATLSGTGACNGTVTIATTGTIKPGNSSPATLTTGALTLNDNSTLTFTLGSTSSKIAVNGNITALDGQLDVTGGAGFANATYTIISYTGSITANNTLTVRTMPSGYTGTISTATANQVNLVVSGPGWRQTITGTINGGAIATDNIYLGTTTPHTLLRRSLTDGSAAGSYTSSYGGVKTPTYCYFTSDSKYRVAAATGNYVICERDNGDATFTDVITSPPNLGSAPGNPYINYTADNYYVVYGTTLAEYTIAATPSLTRSVTVTSASTAADIVVAKDYVYVATTTGDVDRYDAGDFTKLATYSGGTSILLPLAVPAATLYVTPDDGTIRAVPASSMLASGARSYTYNPAATNSGPAYAIKYNTSVYTAAGNYVFKINDDGTSLTKTWATADLTVATTSGPLYFGNIVYVGCANGYYYALNDADGTTVTGGMWPFHSSTSGATFGPWIDINGARNRVIFATSGGNLDAFALQ